jgi:hypothetical protein
VGSYLHGATGTAGRGDLSTKRRETVGEGNHWYSKDGQPVYEVPRAKGDGMRPTTLADARKLELVPGYSTIERVAARPGLERWIRTQVLLAALTLPRLPGESDDAFAERALDDAEREGREAADRGSDIHAEIAALARGLDVPVSLGAMEAWALVRELYGGPEGWIAERSFASPLGYGGRVDLHRAWRSWASREVVQSPSPPIVVDFKSKDDITKKGTKLAYPEHVMQLAAYAEGLGLPFPAVRLVSVYVCRTTHAANLHEWSREEAVKGWEKFQLLLKFWKLANNYDPSF